MAGLGFVARPLSASVRTANDVYFSEITDALLTQFGMHSVACCQPVGSGLFHVTFHSPIVYRGAVNTGLKLRNEVVKVEPVSGAPTTVTLKNVPYEVTADAITSHLRKYGRVLQHSWEYPEAHKPVSNGNRRVRIVMDTPVPNFIRLGPYMIMVVYPGMKRVCRRCNGEGHIAKDCTATYCRVCRRWMDTQECEHVKNGGSVEEVQKDRIEDQGRIGNNESVEDEGMECGGEQNELWIDVFTPTKDDQSVEHTTEVPVSSKESAPVSHTTRNIKSFAEAVEAPSQGPAPKMGPPAVRHRATTNSPERSAAKENQVGAASKVLAPPPMEVVPGVPSVLVPLSPKRKAGDEIKAQCEDVLKRSCSSTSTDSQQMFSAFSDGSEMEVHVSGKPASPRKKKKKGEVSSVKKCDSVTSHNK